MFSGERHDLCLFTRPVLLQYIDILIYCFSPIQYTNQRFVVSKPTISVTFTFLGSSGRYVSIDAGGELVGKAEAVGPREMWEPVFEDVCTVTVYVLYVLYVLYVQYVQYAQYVL